MRATSYCGRGTGEKEINRYGQKERTQEKGPKDPLIGTPFEFPTDTVSCQGSLRQLIYNLQNPGTLYLSLRLWAKEYKTNQDKVFHFILISGLHSNKMERQLSILAAEMFTRGNQNALRYRSRLVVRCFICYASRYGRKDSESAGAGGDGQSLSFQHHCKLWPCAYV